MDRGAAGRRLADVVGIVQLAMALTLLVAADRLADRTFGLTLVVTLCVGWLLASRIPRSPLGWLLLSFSGLLLLAVPAALLGGALIESSPGIGAWLLWYARTDDEDAWAWLPALGLLFTQILLRFPDGALPSPRWRWLSATSAVLLAVATVLAAVAGGDVAPGVRNPVGVAWVDDQDWLVLALGLPLLGFFVASAASVVVRYRDSDRLRRTQIRWFAWSAGIVVGCYVASLLLAPDNDLVNAVVSTSYGLIPASIGIAVLRFRLYEVDRIVSRTLSYAAVSAVVVGTYALVVTSVTRLLDNDTSSLAVGLATLAAAAVFRPVLGRARRVVDRRFDRERYDARRTVDAFGARLRDEVEPDAAAAGLITAVRGTLAPSSVALWLREDTR